LLHKNGNLTFNVQIRFILVQNRQGKTRLEKWYVAVGEDEKQRIKQDMHRLVGARDQRHANFVEVKICH
jgi:hypothetical protein